MISGLRSFVRHRISGADSREHAKFKRRIVLFATAMLLPIIISPFSGALTSGMYFYEAKSSKPVCLLNGLCISFNSKPTELTIAENGLRIGVTVDNVGDVYTLAKISNKAEFSLEDTRVPSGSMPISFKADYSSYSNTSVLNLSA